jgi:FixJ family two-component response regulator
MPETKERHLLLIDPDEREADISRAQLADTTPGTFKFIHRTSIKAVIDDTADERYEIILVDVDLESDDEVLDLNLLCRSRPTTPVVVYTANGDAQHGLIAMRAGAEEFLIKGDMESEQVVWTLFRAIERKRVESSLRSQQSLLHQILDNMPDGVATADKDGNLTFFNKAASALAGIGLTETSPPEWQKTYGIFRSDRVTPYPADETPLFRAIQGEESTDQRLFVRHSGLPQGLLLSLNGRPLVDELGRHTGGIVCFREVEECSEPSN